MLETLLSVKPKTTLTAGAPEGITRAQVADWPTAVDGEHWLVTVPLIVAKADVNTIPVSAVVSMMVLCLEREGLSRVTLSPRLSPWAIGKDRLVQSISQFPAGRVIVHDEDTAGDVVVSLRTALETLNWTVAGMLTFAVSRFCATTIVARLRFKATIAMMRRVFLLIDF